MSLAPLSNCLGIKRGANSTTCGLRPKSRTAFAASRPNKPPPKTAASVAPFCFIFFAYPIIASKSSIVLYTKTPSFSTPSIGGTNAEDPVARTK
ncbi:hypothetical protein D3C85_1460040 [compost metagenome]